MTEEEFASLVSRLQEESKENPGRYRFRVLCWSLLGYGYILLMLLLVGVCLGALVWLLIHFPRAVVVKLAIPVVLLSFLILRALWVRFDHPTGLALDRASAPRLFDLVDRIQEACEAPRADTVLVTDDFNAAVVQIPRFGLLGVPRNYVILGLPLMQALTAEEFEAVLAHEFGHLAGSHGKFGAWIYRIRASWGRLMESLGARQHWGSGIFSRFAKWYFPKFNAYSFVLGRAQEYEADRISCRRVGSRTAADALIRLTTEEGRLSGHFWPEVGRRPLTEPLPPDDLYVSMKQFLASAPDRSECQGFLNTALTIETGVADTHPSLRDRLVAMGEEPRLPGPVRESALDAYLPESAGIVMDQLNERWKAATMERWKSGFEEGERQRSRLREIEDLERTRELDLQELCDKGFILANAGREEQALQCLYTAVDRDPEFPNARMNLAQLLLKRGDEEALQYINEIIRDGYIYTPEACALAYSFLMKQGREAEAVRYREAAEAHDRKVQEAREERARVSIDSEFMAPRLTERMRNNVLTVVAGHEEVREFYLVELKVSVLPRIPAYFVFLELIETKNMEERQTEMMSALSWLGNVGYLDLGKLPPRKREEVKARLGDPLFVNPR